jgi:DNA-binding PadR family transcriptional regulator
MEVMTRANGDQLLLGEWACLGILYPAPTHGFAIAARLKPSGDIGRVWSLSRPLTYRSLEQLSARGYIHAIGEEPGIAGGNRTILAATRTGRARLRKWLQTPVAHMRDMRSELLLKLVIANDCGVDVTAMLRAQREQIAAIVAAHGDDTDDGDTDDRGSGARLDVVSLWRAESSRGALRFVERVLRTIG